MDSERLLNEINKGKGISKEVLAELVSFLRSSKQGDLSADDVYSYVSILGVAGAKEHKQVLEHFLDYKDALTAVKVLQILCLDWGFTEEYLPRVIAFALGVSWDEEQDLRQASFCVIGEFLHIQKQKDFPNKAQASELLSLLFSVFDESAFDLLLRISAYRALCRAAGFSWDRVPAECSLISLSPESKDVDWKMLDALRI